MIPLSLVVWGDETGLVPALERIGSGVTVVRSCVDLVEVLAAVGAGLSRICVLAGPAADLDTTFVEALERGGGRGIALTDDALQRSRLERLGISVLPATASAEDVVTALRRPPPVAPSGGGVVDRPTDDGAGGGAIGLPTRARDAERRDHGEHRGPAGDGAGGPDGAGAPDETSGPDEAADPAPAAAWAGQGGPGPDDATRWRPVQGDPARDAGPRDDPGPGPADPEHRRPQAAARTRGRRSARSGRSDDGGSAGGGPDGAGRADRSAAPAGADLEDGRPRRGAVTVVWGSGGAPGRSTLAANLAIEAALAGSRVALVDADTHAASLAGQLGLLDETAGLVRLCRSLEAGEFDPSRDTAAFARLRAAGASLRFTSGLPRPERWAEISAAALKRAIDRLAHLVDHVVIDVAAPVGRDDELLLDTFAPQRNDATLAAIAAADQLLAVGTADPVGLPRLIRTCEEAAVLPAGPVPRLVVNKVRASVSGPRPETAVRVAWQRFGPPALIPSHFLPWDQEAADAALMEGRALAEAAPRSTLRRAVADLAAVVLPLPVTKAPTGLEEVQRRSPSRPSVRDRLGRAVPR